LLILQAVRPFVYSKTPKSGEVSGLGLEQTDESSFSSPAGKTGPHRFSRGHKDLIECIRGLGGLLVEEFSADLIVLGQIADRFSPGQDRKREVLSVERAKTGCCGRFWGKNVFVEV